MALVSESEVKVLINTNKDVAAFIDTAHLIVTEDLANSGHSSDRLKQIELYLAAHFVALAEEKGNISAKKVGEASERYAMTFDRGFAITRFGQNAIDLDTTGILRTMSRKGGNARLTVV